MIFFSRILFNKNTGKFGNFYIDQIPTKLLTNKTLNSSEVINLKEFSQDEWVTYSIYADEINQSIAISNANTFIKNQVNGNPSAIKISNTCDIQVFGTDPLITNPLIDMKV